MSTVGRLLALTVNDGSSNMATDEAIAEAVASRSVAPTLRFYGWRRPTLSLGYFQSVADALPWNVDPVDIVRRSTGGGAIMHHHELTYSLSLPLDANEPGARASVYRCVHECIRKTLSDRGVPAIPFRDTTSAVTGDQTPVSPKGLAGKRNEPFLCFQRRTDEDLICGGYKILGSAQRRVRGGVLQHGSLLLHTSDHADPLPGICELTGTCLDPMHLSLAITDRIAHAMSIDFRSSELTDCERSTSLRIREERYGADAWTHRR